jgi:hypothetical protein
MFTALFTHQYTITQPESTQILWEAKNVIIDDKELLEDASVE